MEVSVNKIGRGGAPEVVLTVNEAAGAEPVDWYISISPRDAQPELAVTTTLIYLAVNGDSADLFDHVFAPGVIESNRAVPVPPSVDEFIMYV